MKLELKKTIDFVGQEKNLTKDQLLDSLQSGLLVAAEKKYGSCDFEVNYLPETDEFELFRYRRVVEDGQDFNPNLEIPFREARELDGSVQVGDEVGDALSTEGLGRIAARFAKKTVMSKIFEAERNTVFEEFSSKKGELVVGTVRRFDEGDIIVDLGHSEALLPYKEQIPGERFRYRDRIVGYILDVRRHTRGPQITLSRTHPGMLAALLDQEVAEVKDGLVEIKAVARVPGKRAKVAVWSDDPAVAPVGACIGVKGSRIQAITQELNGEQIDVIQYDDEPARFVCSALTPAEVSRIFVYEHLKVMEVILPDDQLSLAIGRRGQNVSLASTLTGWKIDIRSQSRLKELIEEAKIQFAKVPQLDSMRAEILINEGYRDLQELSKLSESYLMTLLNFSEEQSRELAESVQRHLQVDYQESAFLKGQTSGKDERVIELIMEELRQRRRPLARLSFVQEGGPGALEEDFLRKAFEKSLVMKRDSVDWMSLRGVGHAVRFLLVDQEVTLDELLSLELFTLKEKLALPLPFLKKLRLEATARLATQKV